MKESRTIHLTVEEIEEAVREYIFEKKGINIGSIRFDINREPEPGMCFIDRLVLAGAFATASE